MVEGTHDGASLVVRLECEARGRMEGERRASTGAPPRKMSRWTILEHATHASSLFVMLQYDRGLQFARQLRFARKAGASSTPLKLGWNRELRVNARPDRDYLMPVVADDLRR